MTAIEPGDKFVIKYGKGHQLEVKALSLRQSRMLSAKTSEMVKAEEQERGLEIFDLCEQALIIAIGEESAEAIIDTVDAEMAMEIATAVMTKQALSEEDRKKSESPH